MSDKVEVIPKRKLVLPLNNTYVSIGDVDGGAMVNLLWLMLSSELPKIDKCLVNYHIEVTSHFWTIEVAEPMPILLIRLLRAIDKAELVKRGGVTLKELECSKATDVDYREVQAALSLPSYASVVESYNCGTPL